MASELHLIVSGPPAGAIEDAVAELSRLEACWSRFRADSDVSRLNAAAGRPLAVDPSTLVLLATMVEAWRQTAGGYDPSVLPAMVANGYGASLVDAAGRYMPPGMTGVAGTGTPGASGPAAAAGVPAGRHADRYGMLAEVALDGEAGTACLPEGLALDPGGIGKGLAADLVVRRLLEAGAVGALVAIGGDLAMGGRPPSEQGWSVVIERPDPAEGDLATIRVSGGGVATSSTRSRRWVIDGVERHHHIDPATGLPSTTDLDAVTVIAATGWQAEAHASAALGRGSAGAIGYLQGHGLSGVAFPAGGGAPLVTGDLEPLRRRVTGAIGVGDEEVRR